MTYDPNDFVIRRPRHSAEDASQCRVWLESQSELAVAPQDVQLLDFSRRGAKVELRNSVPPDAPVVLHFVDESLGLDVDLLAHVQWQRTAGVGCWLLGCQFEEPVAYEVIGELFLSGVLSTCSPSE